LKEKLLAALRTGLKTVIIPADNEKDLADIPDNVKKGLEIRPVSSMEEVLRIALIREPTPIVWEDAEDAPSPAARLPEADDSDAVVTH
jgi:ATP-dependent Lon protease